MPVVSRFSFDRHIFIAQKKAERVQSKKSESNKSENNEQINNKKKWIWQSVNCVKIQKDCYVINKMETKYNMRKKKQKKLGLPDMREENNIIK